MKEKISLILAIRNEEKTIKKTLDSIINNEFNKKNYEIIIVDGKSKDKTIEIVKYYKKKNSNIKLYENPKGIVASGLNIGIKKSKGKIILRLDGHKIYPKKYISILVDYLNKNPDVGNVGCGIETIIHKNSVIEKCIAEAVSSSFGVGNSKFRTNKIMSKQIEDVDTVPFGCFRKELFQKIGFFDEKFIRNQDDEFNLRIKKFGMRIVLINSIKVKDFARTNFSNLFKMFFGYGYYKPMIWKKHKTISSFRQLIPLFNIINLIFCVPIFYITELKIFLIFMIFYLLFILFFSIKVLIKHKNFLSFIFSFFAIFIIHNAYATGNLFMISKMIKENLMFKSKKI